MSLEEVLPFILAAPAEIPDPPTLLLLDMAIKGVNMLAV